MNRVFACSAIVLLLILAGCGGQEPRIETVVEVPVSVEDIELTTIEEFTTTTGTVIASDEAAVTTESTGYYRLATNPATGKKLSLGDQVKKDQVIVYTDNPEQEMSIRLDSVKLSLDIAKNNYDKQQSLFEKGGVTETELTSAEKSYIDAQYAYDDALLQLTKLETKAPISGVIVSIPIFTEGVRVNSGTQVATIMDYKTLLMEIQLPSALMSKITVGQPIRVTNYAVSDETLEGSITEVAPTLDATTRTFAAKVEIDNQDLLLRPGMFVKADIVTARHDSTVVIPKTVITTRGDRKFVYIVDRGYARSRIITTGIENPEYIEVTEGLEPADRLVISGFETLRDGAKVTISR